MSCVSVENATTLRNAWQRLQADAMPLPEEECYSSAVLRTLPSHVEEELRRKILKPQLTRRQMRNREAGIPTGEWTPAALAPGTEKVAFIREKIFRIMIAVAKSNPELSRNEDIFDLQVALVFASRSERVSFCTFVRLSNFFRLLDFSDPPDAPTFERSPSWGRPPTDGPLESIEIQHAASSGPAPVAPTTLTSQCAVRPVMPVEPSTTSSAGSRREDPLIQDILQVWKAIRQQYPEVATAIQQDRRTKEMFVVCVCRWLQTLFAAGSSTSEQQLYAYVPLLDFMVFMAYRKLDCMNPRQLLWRIAVCIFGCHRGRIEELQTNVEAMEALLQQFADRPPIDSRVLLAVACQVSKASSASKASPASTETEVIASGGGVGVLKGFFAWIATSAWSDFIPGRGCVGVLQSSFDFISGSSFAAAPRRSSRVVSPAQGAVAEEGPVLEDAQQSPFRLCRFWMPNRVVNDIDSMLIRLRACEGRQC